MLSYGNVLYVMLWYLKERSSFHRLSTCTIIPMFKMWSTGLIGLWIYTYYSIYRLNVRVPLD